MPYGRVYEKKADKWGLDAEKAEGIRYAAEHYLRGKSLDSIAATIGLDKTHLWRILNNRSGDQWPVKFSAPDLNIDESVILKVPRLLDDETIKAVKEREKQIRRIIIEP